jgi:hypothetical protein
MAITRTPIIDDDGTGTTGTVIDNAWKTELYNQIDAVAGGGPWLTGGYAAAAYFAAAPMTWTVEAADLLSNWYLKAGRVLTWDVNIANAATGGSPSTTLYIWIPEGVVPAVPVRSNGKLYTPAIGWVDMDVQTTTQAGTPVVSITKLDLSAFTITSSIYVHFHLHIPY